MKLIIAGSRDISISPSFIQNVIWAFGIEQPAVIISGGAKGVDTIAKAFAEITKLEYREFLPDWNVHGKAAGPIRNAEMARNGDALLLIWDGKSKGSKSMFVEAARHDLPIYEVVIAKHGIKNMRSVNNG